MKNVIIFDTSILCCWLSVVGKETCGAQNDLWNKERIENYLQQCAGSVFVLPLAAIIETGNHISQAPDRRYECAENFCSLVARTVNEGEPWAAFSQQDVLWEKGTLLDLADSWPEKAAKKISFGDATIINVANFYANIGYEVELLTGDEGLKAYQPAVPIPLPRRRRK